MLKRSKSFIILGMTIAVVSNFSTSKIYGAAGDFFLDNSGWILRGILETAFSTRDSFLANSEGLVLKGVCLLGMGLTFLTGYKYGKKTQKQEYTEKQAAQKIEQFKKIETIYQEYREESTLLELDQENGLTLENLHTIIGKRYSKSPHPLNHYSEQLDQDREDLKKIYIDLSCDEQAKELAEKTQLIINRLTQIEEKVEQLHSKITAETEQAQMRKEQEAIMRNYETLMEKYSVLFSKQGNLNKDILAQEAYRAFGNHDHPCILYNRSIHQDHASIEQVSTASLNEQDKPKINFLRTALEEIKKKTNHLLHEEMSTERKKQERKQQEKALFNEKNTSEQRIRQLAEEMCQKTSHTVDMMQSNAFQVMHETKQETSRFLQERRDADQLIKYNMACFLSDLNKQCEAIIQNLSDQAGNISDDVLKLQESIAQLKQQPNFAQLDQIVTWVNYISSQLEQQDKDHSKQSTTLQELEKIVQGLKKSTQEIQDTQKIIGDNVWNSADNNGKDLDEIKKLLKQRKDQQLCVQTTKPDPLKELKAEA